MVAKRTLLPLAIAVGVIFLDQLTKALVLKFLTAYQPIEIVPGLLNFNLVFNDRAAFSLGGASTWVFTATSTLAALALLYFVPRFSSRAWLILGGFALGGVVGNLIDRLVRAPGFPNGQVVDFIQLPLGFPVFNVADMAISISAFVIAIRVIRGDKIGGRK